MDWGEVTASHTNLLAIAQLSARTAIPLEIVRITQARERSLGADWEFWLTLRSGKSLGYSIQAKRVYEVDGVLQYSGLGHRGELASERQYDTLIRHAAAVGSLPFHVFYNGWQLPNGRVAFPRSLPDYLYGCAAVPSADVRAIRNAFKRKGVNNADRYAARSMPWSDLFRIDPLDLKSSTGVGSPSPKPRGVAAALSQKDLIAIQSRWSQTASHSAGLREGLPDYVEKARLLFADSTINYALPEDAALPEYAVVLQSG